MAEKHFKLLLQETVNSEIDKSTIKETYKAGSKVPVIQWKNGLTNTGKETANGTHFLYEDICLAIEKRYFKKRIEEGKAYNEFRHPSRVDPERYCMVDEGEASDRILNLEWLDNGGAKWLVGLCETATFAKGPMLYEMIMSGANPSKSIRASGDIWTDDQGRSRKDLMIMAWDNVFIGADEDSWGIKGTFVQTSVNRDTLFRESMMPEKYIREMKQSLENIKADRAVNKSAIRCWLEADIKSVQGAIKSINSDIYLIGESVSFKPTKVLVDHTGREIVYISESENGVSKVKTTIDTSVRGDVLSFFKSKI